MKKFLFVALCFYSAGSQADSISSTCAEVYNNSKVKNFDINDFEKIQIRSNYYEPPKAEYEKTDAYKIRLKEGKKKILLEDTKIIPFLDQRDLVKFNTSVSTKYNADKELLKVGGGVLSVGQVKVSIGGADKNYSGFKTIFGKQNEEPYKLGVTKISSQDYGVAYTTKLKSVLLNGKDIKIKLTPNIAEQSVANLNLVIAGKLVPPYSQYNSGSYDNMEELKMVSYRTIYVIVDVTCAALVDMKTKKVIYELK